MPGHILSRAGEYKRKRKAIANKLRLGWKIPRISESTTPANTERDLTNGSKAQSSGQLSDANPMSHFHEEADRVNLHDALLHENLHQENVQTTAIVNDNGTSDCSSPSKGGNHSQQESLMQRSIVREEITPRNSSQNETEEGILPQGNFHIGQALSTVERRDDEGGENYGGNNSHTRNKEDSIHADEKSHSFLSSKLTSLNVPLKLKSGPTAKDHLLAFLTIFMKHHLTYEALMSIFSWLNSTLLCKRFPKTKAALWDRLDRNDDMCVRYVYCRYCRSTVGKAGDPDKVCDCGKRIEMKSAPYYLSIDLRSQLLDLFSIPNISKSLQYRFDRKKLNEEAMEDIYDGKAYKEQAKPGNFLSHKWNFSFTFNLDGVQVAKSSKASAYPIWVQLNELPPHMRKKHMLLAGLWIDEEKPSANDFLFPFVEQLQQLYSDGIVWKTHEGDEITSKFIAIIFNADSVARCDFLRMFQFNGLYGCTFCYAPGESCEGQSSHKKYRVGEYELRTDESIRNDAVEAMTLWEQHFESGSKNSNANINYRGVKGPSAIGLIPHFDLGNGPIVDLMHQSLAGAIKQHSERLFGDTGEAWYIGSPKDLEEIDRRLLSIALPSRISRYPRSIKTRNDWKASEWRNWGYYCLPCLEGILPKRYLSHLAQLCEVLYMVNQDSIPITEIIRARPTLKKYQEKYQKTFGVAAMTYNIHLFDHMLETILNWGPSWAHNAFVFEAMNHKIIQHVTRPHERLLQVYARFLMTKFIQNCSYDDSIDLSTRDFIAKEFNIVYDVPTNEMRFTAAGIKESRAASQIEEIILRRAGYSCNVLAEFDKARVNGIEYRCCDFRPNTKFSNSLVFCKEIGFGEIRNIVQFVNNDAIVNGLFITKMRSKGPTFGTTFITTVEKTKEMLFIPIDEILGPVFQVCYDNHIRCIRLPNVWESD